MKKIKNNKKGKFVNLNDYDKGTKPLSDYKSINFETKPLEVYETPLQTLQRLYPNFSNDVIESVFEENNRTFAISKKMLADMCEQDKEVSEEEEMVISEELNEEEYPDINKFTNFKYEGDDPFIDDSCIPEANSKLTNTTDIRKKKYQVDLNTLINLQTQSQKKNVDDYVSVFTSLANESTPTKEVKPYKTPSYEDFYLEDLTLDYYCDVLSEFFPNFSRTEIMQKICEYDLDIDKLVLALFDENNDNILNEEMSKLELADISEDYREEVLSNFYAGETVKIMQEDLSYMEKVIFSHNLQNNIEKEIKKNNVNAKLNVLYSEKDFPFLSDESRSDIINSNKISDEYFLDKDIKDIKTKSIREDLIRLSKNFIFTDETVLKWVYFQLGCYNETFKYFKKNGKKKDKMFDDVSTMNASLYSDRNKSNANGKDNRNILSSNKGFIVEKTEDNYQDFLYKIISENPNQWRIENNCKKINISDYQTIRKKLIWQAQVAWRNGRHQDAKVIMAKARRYKQEINTLLADRKIEVFLKNNDSILLPRKENFIDLHGLNYEESKSILNKKIQDVRRGIEMGSIDESKRFILHVITGVGNHSKDHKAVLLPRLSAMLRREHFVKVDEEKGVIKVFL